MVRAASIGPSFSGGLRAPAASGNSRERMTLKVILASGSPRRRQLLGAAGIEFEVIESGMPERHRAGEPPRDYALRMARDKAGAVSSRFPDAIVVGADTIVVCESQILEKPADAADARRMLAMLSGQTHTVVTAFALARGGKILEARPSRAASPFANSPRRKSRTTSRPASRSTRPALTESRAWAAVSLRTSRDRATT